MTNNIELLSQHDNFTIGTNSNLTEILANVVKVGTDTSNVTISIPQDISSSYNLILPVRQGASGESLVYGADGQLKWHDPTVLKQVVSVYGSGLMGNLISTTGTHDSPTYLDTYTANIIPKSENSKIFVQFKINYHAALSASNQISFFIKKTYDSNETIFTESLFGPYNAAGGFTGQYISNLVDEALTSNSISYQLGYQINGNVYATDVLGILGYDNSHNNTIVLQEFEGSGVYATSVWNKGSDSNGLYYNDGTVHIGSSKDALGSQNTLGVALELSGNLVGTHAYFSGQVNADTINAREGYFSANTLYINNKPVLNEDAAGNRTVNTDVMISDASNGLNIKAIGDNGNIILDPSGTGTIQLNGDVELSGGNINAETFIGDLSGNVNGNLVGDVTGDVTGNVSGVLTGSMTMTGHILPDTNGEYDIGSAEYKVRHMYLSNNSLWIGDEHKATINPDTSQLEFRRRITDAIPHSFILAEKYELEILNEAGEASLSDMSLGKWEQVARSLGITINGKTGLDIDSTDIFDTGVSDDWQTTLDIKTIADNVTNNTGDISTIQGNISSLETSVASKQATITPTTDLSINDLTLSGCLRGPSTMYIDPANDGVTGTLIVNGNLQVKGTTTTIDSETLLIADNSIILNKDYTGGLPTENASIKIERGTLDNAIIQWNEDSDQWEFYKAGTTLSNIKCNTIRVDNNNTLGNISASFLDSTLTIIGDTNISYGVCTAIGNPGTLSTLSVSNIEKNTQILIYYTNNSGDDINIGNVLTINEGACKTNLSEELTVGNGSSVLFCLVNINSTYILTVSQLY